MAKAAVPPSALLPRAAAALAAGRGQEAMELFDRAAAAAAREGDLPAEVEAVLGLARGQLYNVTPGALPVRLHDVLSRAREPADRARLAAALARCWVYGGEPHRAVPFAEEALDAAGSVADPHVLADALDAALTAHWGPDDLELRRGLALRLGDAAAHLRDPDARLQAHLWGLTVAWEVLDLPRMHREIRALEGVGEESPRARFFAASRRLALDLLRGRPDTAPMLRERAAAAANQAFIPDHEGVLHNMTAYPAFFAGDAETCAAEAPGFEDFAVDQGSAAVRAEAAVIWLGAGRLDRVRAMVSAFTPETLAALPRDSDWLLTLQCVLEGALAAGVGRVRDDVSALLAGYEGRAVVNAGALMFHGVTDDTLARAAAQRGEVGEAERLGAAALATYDRIGATWWRDRLAGALRLRPVDPAGTRLVHLSPQPGGLWLVGRDGSATSLPALRGLAHLHVLLSQPGVAVPALDLVAPDARQVVDQGGLELLDERARRSYRARLAQIDDELDEAAQWADAGRLQRLGDEREALLAELGAAAGLGGRARTTGSTEERARVAVRKAVVAALARIAEADPWLGRHLHDRVSTGAECRYDPDPDRPVRWSLHA